MTPVGLKLARVFLLAMETTYTIVDQPAQSSKRSGVFLKYKIIAVVAVIVLVVVVTLVLLAAFLGPGRKRSCSEECGDGDGKTKIGKAGTQRSRLFYRTRSFFGWSGETLPRVRLYKISSNLQNLLNHRL